MLETFFHAGGDGLSLDDLQTDVQQSLVRVTKYHESTTEALIDYYYQYAAMRLGDCESMRHLGTVTLRAQRKEGQLIVTVLHAKDVIAADVNGSSDPFLQLAVMPPGKINILPQKTTVVKKSLNPTWNEKFTFATTNHARLKTLLFEISLFDYDLVGSNDFLGTHLFLIRDFDEACKEYTVPLLDPFTDFPPETLVIRGVLGLKAKEGDKRAQAALKTIDARRVERAD